MTNLRRLNLVLVMLVCTHSISAKNVFYIQNLSGEFSQSSGHFTTDQLSLELGALKLDSQRVDFPFELNEQTFSTQIDQFDFSYELASDGITSSIKGLYTDDLDLHYIENEYFKLSTYGVSLVQAQSSQNIPRLEIECRKNQKSNFVDTIINPCLQTGRIELPSVNLDALSSKSVSKTLGMDKGIDEITDIKMLIFSKSFQLTFRAKFIFNWKVKSSGSVNYDEAKGLIDIHLNKAKVGFISVKNKVLEELSGANLESVKVIGDHIQIKI